MVAERAVPDDVDLAAFAVAADVTGTGASIAAADSSTVALSAAEVGWTMV